MAQGSDAPVVAPKLHGTFTITRLSGAGIVLTRRPTESEPDRAVLVIGDSATNLALDGTLDEIECLVAEAGSQISRLRQPHHRWASNDDGHEEPGGAPRWPDRESDAVARTTRNAASQAADVDGTAGRTCAS